MKNHSRYIDHIVNLWAAGYHPALQAGSIETARKHVNALASLAESKTKQCSILQSQINKLRSDSNPELLASERAANAILTAEIDRLESLVREYQSILGRS